MQLLFLLNDIFNNPQAITVQVTSKDFLLTILLGIITVILLVLFIKNIIKEIAQLIKTKKYIQNLKKVGKYNEKTYIINSNNWEVFTAGFLNPKVYISNGLLHSLNEKQLNAVLMHEYSHCIDRDPLKGYIVSSITTFPLIFFKERLKKIYDTTVELKCDQYAQNLTSEKDPLIESLYLIAKAQTNTNAIGVNSLFKNMPERIPVLLNIKPFNFKITAVSALYLLFASFFLAFSVYIARPYNCSHLQECFTTFVNNVVNNSNMNLCIENHTSTMHCSN